MRAAINIITNIGTMKEAAFPAKSAEAPSGSEAKRGKDASIHSIQQEEGNVKAVDGGWRCEIVHMYGQIGIGATLQWDTKLGMVSIIRKVVAVDAAHGD